jgi:hypothetical protein
MVKQNSSDNNYTDGCRYQYKTQLTPGTYAYSFECYDGKFTNSPPITYLWLIVYDANIATITNFTIVSPQNIITDKTPEIICRIFVSGAGINISTAQYAYSTTGNQNPINWVAVDGVFLDAACMIPASKGARGYIYLKINAVPFNQSSITKNIIRFRASDMAGIQVIQSNSDNIKIKEETAVRKPIHPIIIIMIVVGAISVNLFITTHKKEHKFQSIANKILNQTPEPTMVFKEILEVPEKLSYDELLHVMNMVVQLFPPLKNYFPENLHLYLKDLISMPDTEIFAFFSALIGKIPENELRQGINELKSKFKEHLLIKDCTEILVPKIKGLFEWIELIQDRNLLDNLSIFLILSVIQLKNPKINS